MKEPLVAISLGDGVDYHDYHAPMNFNHESDLGLIRHAACRAYFKVTEARTRS